VRWWCSRHRCAHEDLRAFLGALHVRRASLVGLSGGGRIAIDFALAYPRWWTGSCSPRRGSAAGSTRRATRRTSEAPPRARSWRHGGLGSRGSGAPTCGRRWNIRSWCRGCEEMAAANGGNWMGLLRHAIRTRRRSPRAPSHRDAGGRRPSSWSAHRRPGHSGIRRHPQRNVRGLRREAFEGPGHLVNMEQPQRFTALVRDFLRP